MIITDKIEASDEILASGGFADIRSTTLASGGFADVRCGRYMGRLVALKTLKVPEQGDLLKIRKVSINNIFPAARDAVSTIILQQFCKEVILWNTISHPNVLKLAGVQGDMEDGQFVTVSEWMAHGNIMEYIKTNHVNRLELVRDFIFPTLPSLKCDNSCAGQLRV
jgi:serine/threonine protein kinase